MGSALAGRGIHANSTKAQNLCLFCCHPPCVVYMYSNSFFCANLRKIPINICLCSCCQWLSLSLQVDPMPSAAVLYNFALHRAMFLLVPLDAPLGRAYRQNCPVVSMVKLRLNCKQIAS
ncbi:TPA: hypothetical protein ACH3X2_002695 [Trebouxia sp. C0005]